MDVPISCEEAERLVKALDLVDQYEEDGKVTFIWAYPKGGPRHIRDEITPTTCRHWILSRV